MDTDQTTQNQRGIISRPDKSFVRYSLAVLVITLVVVAGWWYSSYSSRSQNLTGRITIGDTTWQIIGKAATDEARARGLSHRPSLDPGTGMLFLFETAGNYGFWMKDMQFPIDIIFIHDGVVDAVARDRSPGDLDPVFPTGATDQVFEVNAGEAHGIEPGDRVLFKTE